MTSQPLDSSSFGVVLIREVNKILIYEHSRALASKENESSHHQAQFSRANNFPYLGDEIFMVIVLKQEER